MLTIERASQTVAVEYGRAHVEVNPTHRLLVACCEHCAFPIGVMCLTCHGLTVAIDGPDCHE